MAVKKTLQQRERELQVLLATPAGIKELQVLVDRYSAAGDKVKPERTSLVTFILVYERKHGLIID